jgi:radical SAM protein with 4Fe4S-binding SPASM domain
VSLAYRVKRGLLKARSEGVKQVASLVVRDTKTKVQLSLVESFPRLAWTISPQLSGVYLEPTSMCNLRCAMCGRGSRPSGFMDYSLWTRLIDEIAEVGNCALVLHMGGESLVHPRFLDMLEYTMSKRRRLRRVGFVTNGTLLSDRVQQRIVDLQVDWVTVSLDGLGRVNDEIRIGSKYEQIEANIRGLIMKRGRKRKPEVGLSLTDVGQSRTEIDDFIEAWVGIADNIRVAPCQNMKDNRWVDRRYFANLDIEQNGMCPAPFATMAVLWNGDVVGCCTDLNGVQILGNVQNKSLKSVWNGPAFRQIRRDLATHHVQERPLCNTCELWQLSIKSKPEAHDRYTVRYESVFKFYQKRNVGDR